MQEFSPIFDFKVRQLWDIAVKSMERNDAIFTKVWFMTKAKQCEHGDKVYTRHITRVVQDIHQVSWCLFAPQRGKKFFIYKTDAGRGAKIIGAFKLFTQSKTSVKALFHRWAVILTAAA